MNVFYLDQHVENCAKMHLDKHVVKMRLEMAQIACTVHHKNGTDVNIIPYKKTHQNHPCIKWAEKSLGNYAYIVSLGLELCNELDFRFGTKEQKCREVLNWLAENLPDIPFKGETIPPNCFDPKYIVNKEYSFKAVIENYKNYYLLGKTDLIKYTKREKPKFILDGRV